MSHQVAIQSDIGNLSLRGLEAFSSMLAAISADNVVPMAMIQMQQLGAAFHINGDHAAKVPDLLRRSSSIRLERLGLAVGWRQGDAASFMADSAGGQAISLLSMCLTNLYSATTVGDILFRLSPKLLPAELAVSSISQLHDVARLLAPKLGALGFGNFLAHQVMKVHQVYEHLGKNAPNDFLDQITADSVVEVLYSISKSLREEELIMRVTGTHGMGYILSIVLLMFPHDAVVTMDGIVIHEGIRQTILLEFCEASGGPTQIQVGTVLSRSNSIPIPIDPAPPHRYKTPIADSNLGFSWHGWVADRLQLEFLAVGLSCPHNLLSAISALLILLPSASKTTNTRKGEVRLPRGGLESMLGPFPLPRMQQVCQQILRTMPLDIEMELPTAFSNLVQSASESAKLLNCSCVGNMCNLADCRTSPGVGRAGRKTCGRYRIWSAIFSALNAGLVCFFINPGPNTSVNVPDPMTAENMSERILGTQLDFVPYGIACGTLIKACFSLIGGWFGGVGASSGSSTVIPTILRDFWVPSQWRVSFELVEGQFVYGGRYHRHLCCASADDRPKARKSLASNRKEVIPSCLGEHSNILITIRECMDRLELRATARFSGSNINLNLPSIIDSYIGLDRTDPCPHPQTDPLNTKYNRSVITTSVASPHAHGSRVAIAMVQSNPTAQLLCCDPQGRSILQSQCCLNCAFVQAKGNFHTIIVC